MKDLAQVHYTVTTPSARTCIVRSTVERFGTFQTLLAAHIEATIIDKHFNAKLPFLQGEWMVVHHT